MYPGILRRFAAILFTAVVLAAPAAARDAPGRAMTIATHEAPPFAMKENDGKWHGLAIDLWRTIADEKGYSYRFVESDLAGMTNGVANGAYDASVGALTITADREKRVDFTQPFYATGFGIAVRKSPTAWLSLFQNFFTWQFLQAVLALSALLLFVGLLFWLVERRRNPEEFPENAKGLGAGFWFSAVTMTTVGYGDKAPRTAAGKVVALVWMFAAILIISTFTGMIASSLTADRLSGTVAGPGDLPGVAVGSIAGSASDAWLGDAGVGFTSYPNIDSGLAAVRKGDIDAFVYDAPLLRYRINRGFRKELKMVPGTFGRQDYGIALPEGSPLREAIDVALLEQIDSGEWRRQVSETLGSGD